MKTQMMIVLAGVALTASAVDTLTLEMNFNGTLAVAPGETVGRVRLPAEYRDKQALVITPEQSCQVAHGGALAMTQGTLEMRITPLDWNGGDDDGFKNFFHTRSGNDVILLRKIPGGKLQFMIGTLSRNIAAAVVDVSAWRAGDAHHIRAIWTPERLFLSCDGQAGQAVRRRPGEFRLGAEFTLGGKLWPPTAGRTAVDQLKWSAQAAAIPVAPPSAPVPAAKAATKAATKAAAGRGIELDFNGNTRIKGLPHPADAVGAPAFADGDSLLVGADKRYFIPHGGNLSGESGTLEIRLRPVDWSGSDNSNKYFIYSRVGADIVMLRKGPDGRLAFSIGAMPYPLTVAAEVVDWQPGQWHTVKAVWNREKVMLYLDGEPPVAAERKYAPLKTMPRFWLGGTIWAPVAGESAIDFLKVTPTADFSAPSGSVEKSAPVTFTPLPGNIVTAAHGAVLLPSSQFRLDKSKSAEAAMDGIFSTWYRSEPGATQRFLELRYAAPVQITGVRLTPFDAFAPSAYTVAARDGAGRWREIARSGNVASQLDFPAVSTDRLQIRFADSETPIGIRELEAVGDAGSALRLPTPHWLGNYIWGEDSAAKVGLRCRFRCVDPSQIERALFQISADDSFELYFNGERLDAGGFSVKRYELKERLRPGVNVIAVNAVNFSGPSGVLAELLLFGRDGRVERIGSRPETWQFCPEPGPEWFKTAEAGNWPAARWSRQLGGYAKNIGYYSGVGAGDGGFTLTRMEGVPDTVRPGTTLELTAYLSVAKPLPGDCGFRAIIGMEPVSDSSDYTVSSVDVMPETPVAQWVPNREYPVRLKFSLPNWAPHGSFPLRLRALAAAGEFPIRKQLETTVKIRRFESEPKLRSRPAQCELRRINDQLRMVIDGEVMPPLVFAVNAQFTTYRELGEQSSIQAGVYRFSPQDCSLYVPDGVDPERHFERICKGLDQQIREVLRFYPDARLLLPFDCRKNYANSRPEEALNLPDGRKLMYSSASEVWLEETIRGGRRIIEHLLQSDYAGHIAGIVISCGAGGETMLWGYGVNASGTPRDAWQVGDFSPASQRAFRRYLQRRYDGDVSRLRRAWRRGKELDFDRAAVEIAELRRADHGSFRDPGRGRMAMDYWDFHSDIQADAVARIAAAFKAASRNHWLIGAWGFYSLAVYPGITGLTPGGMHHIGGLSLDRLMDKPELDFLACIQGYAGVRDHTALQTNMPVASLKRHKKLFIEEFDVRTFFVDLNRVNDHHTTSKQETIQVMRRDFGEAVTRGDHSWFCGFATGYSGRAAIGWYAEDDLIALVNRCGKIGKKMGDFANPSAAEVAVFINNRDVATLDLSAAADVLINSQMYLVYQELKPRGIPADVYMLGDLSAELAARYKVIIMAHCSYLDAAARQKIRAALAKAGNSVLWLHAPGYADPENGLDVRAVGELTGMAVGEVAGDGKAWTIQVDAPGFARHEFAPRGHYRSTAALTLTPQFAVTDPAAEVLGRFKTGNQPAVARKKIGGKNVYYCAAPLASGTLLADICRLAGVHQYTADYPLNLVAGERLLAFHAQDRAIDTLIRLPRPTALAELYGGRKIGDAVESFRLRLRPGESRLFFRGTPGEVAAMLTACGGAQTDGEAVGK